MKTIAWVALFASLVLAETCPEQQFWPITGLDESRIVTDPVTGRKLPLPRVYGYTKQLITITRRACDPDNDDPNYPPQLLKLWREPQNIELPLDPNGNYQLTVSYDVPGWHYETLALTDGVSVRKGTIPVYVRINRPPVFCGALQ